MHRFAIGLWAGVMGVTAVPAAAQLQPPTVTRFPDPSQRQPAPTQPSKPVDGKTGEDTSKPRTEGQGVSTEITREPGKTTVKTTVPSEPDYNPMGVGGYRPMGR